MKRLIQIYLPVSHRVKYFQANRKVVSRLLNSFTKKRMVKKCSDHNNLFRELEGKKEILAGIMNLPPLALIIVAAGGGGT